MFRAKLFNLSSRETLLSRSLWNPTSANFRFLTLPELVTYTHLLQCHVHSATKMVSWPQPTKGYKAAALVCFWQEMLMPHSLKDGLKKPCSLKMAMLTSHTERCAINLQANFSQISWRDRPEAKWDIFYWHMWVTPLNQKSSSNDNVVTKIVLEGIRLFFKTMLDF